MAEVSKLYVMNIKLLVNHNYALREELLSCEIKLHYIKKKRDLQIGKKLEALQMKEEDIKTREWQLKERAA
jgi:hypothetical protein